MGQVHHIATETQSVSQFCVTPQTFCWFYPDVGVREGITGEDIHIKDTGTCPSASLNAWICI